MKRIKNEKEGIRDYIQKKINFFNSDGFAKFIICMVIICLTFIPTYIGTGFYFLLGPVGFWQLLAFFSLCIFFLGAIQFGFIIAAVFLVFSIIVEA